MGAVLRQEPFRRTTLALAFLAGLGAACRSGDAPPSAPQAGVGIGDRAPPLDVADWVHRGTARPAGPVTTFQPGTIYVLEFWATWCEHSRATVPVLAALQERFADDGVVVIGLTIESPESLRGFLADGDMDVRDLAARAGRYGLVVDPDGSVQEAFMDAIGEVSIPTAFLIGRDGRVEWIGHPADLVDPLEQVVAGTWDRTAFASRWSQLQAARACLAGIPIPLPEDRAAEVAAIVDRFIAAHATETLALNEVAWLIVERADFGRVPDAVLAAAERAAARSVSQATTDGNHLDTLAHLQALRGDITAAIATQKRAVEHGGADAERYRAFLSELEVLAAGRDNAP